MDDKDQKFIIEEIKNISIDIDKVLNNFMEKCKARNIDPTKFYEFVTNLFVSYLITFGKNSENKSEYYYDVIVRFKKGIEYFENKCQ